MSPKMSIKFQDPRIFTYVFMQIEQLPSILKQIKSTIELGPHEWKFSTMFTISLLSYVVMNP